MTPSLVQPIPIRFPFIPPSLRLFVHLVNQKWAFSRYSQDMSKFHCLTCRSSTHCRHWFDFRSSNHAVADEMRTDQHAKVQDEIAMHVDIDGSLQSTGFSTTLYAIYNLQQKAILQNREAWVISQLHQQLSLVQPPQIIADALESVCDITAHIARLSTVLLLEDPVESRRSCLCSESDLTRIPSVKNAILLSTNKLYNVCCVTFQCSECGSKKQYDFGNCVYSYFIFILHIHIVYPFENMTSIMS